MTDELTGGDQPEIDGDAQVHAQIRKSALASDNGQPTYQVFKPFSRNVSDGVGRVSVDHGCSPEEAFLLMTEVLGFGSEGVLSVAASACRGAGADLERAPEEGRPTHAHIVYTGSQKKMKQQAQAVFQLSLKTWPRD